MTTLKAFLEALHAVDEDSNATAMGGFSAPRGLPRVYERMLTPGTILDDRYELMGWIGRGGMATIWEARDLRLGRVVATKFLGSQLVEDLEYRSRFGEEARATARLQSPYVVQVYDRGSYQGVPFIVMERLHGEDLHDRLARVKRLSIRLVSTIANEAGRALKATHALGIVHRDLKPKNLFLVADGAEGTVKLLDFGVAKQVGASRRLTATGVTLGSPFYMSPEQIRCERDIDGRADLWSLAVILYASLTGTRPFNGDLASVFLAITTGRPIAPSRLCGDLPRGLDLFFDKALATDRQDRYGDASEFMCAFAHAIRPARPANLELIMGRGRTSPSAEAAAEIELENMQTTRVALADLQRSSRGSDVLFVPASPETEAPRVESGSTGEVWRSYKAPLRERQRELRATARRLVRLLAVMVIASILSALAVFVVMRLSN